MAADHLPNAPLSRLRRTHSSITWLRILCLIVCLLWCGTSTPAPAQISDELAGIFRQIIDHVDSDLKPKFQRALQEQSDLIQFTPDQFRRFRDHPINPFDSLLEIDPNELEGVIELKFELPSLRTREIHASERQHQTVLGDLAGIADRACLSTVSVLREGQIVALGVVVDSQGHILTKASQLTGTGEVPTLGTVVQLENSQRQAFVGHVYRLDPENDLAVLKTQMNNLIPVEWSDHQPLVGDFVFTVNARGQVVAIGTYGHSPRSVLGTEQAYLGIQPQASARGIVVVDVTPSSAAARAGIQPGDLLNRVNGKPIREVTELVMEIRRQRPGAVVHLELTRQGRAVNAQVELSSRKMTEDRAARFQMMNRLGAIPSHRASDFRSVFQHDAPLFPEQCGGPVIDLDGRVVGLNIARQGRVSTLALPNEVVRNALNDLLRPDVAEQRGN